MKKILPIIIIGFLVISGLGAVNINADNIETNDENFKSYSHSLNVGFPLHNLAQYNKEYLEINMDEVVEIPVTKPDQEVKRVEK